MRIYVYLHEQHRPCLPNPTNIVKQRLQYAGLLKCFNFHECVPSSRTFYYSTKVIDEIVCRLERK